MHRDNKPYLISLCSLMSQLKGLVLPLAMGLAERIVCRLVNTGPLEVLERVQNACLVPQTFSYAHVGVPAASRFPVSNGRSTTQWLVGIITHSEIYSNTYHIRQASHASQNTNMHDSHPRPTMLLNVLGMTSYYSAAD